MRPLPVHVGVEGVDGDWRHSRPRTGGHGCPGVRRQGDPGRRRRGCGRLRSPPPAQGHVQQFANLRKGLAGFEKLKEAVKQDPASLTDPAMRDRAEKRIRNAWTAARRTSTRPTADCAAHPGQAHEHVPPRGVHAPCSHSIASRTEREWGPAPSAWTLWARQPQGGSSGPRSTRRRTARSRPPDDSSSECAATARPDACPLLAQLRPVTHCLSHPKIHNLCSPTLRP